jgi:hypothetical protein
MEHPPIWCGNRYRTGGMFPARILVVGESTYPGSPDDNTWLYNQRIPQEHIDGTLRHGFGTRLVRALLGSSGETAAQISAVWQSVAFFNYITEPLSGPGEAPSDDAWLAHHQPLDVRLVELQPEVILFLSYRLWDRLVGDSVVGVERGPMIERSRRPQTYWFRIREQKRALGYGMMHPTYMSWRAEHECLTRLLSFVVPSNQRLHPTAPRLIKRRG